MEMDVDQTSGNAPGLKSENRKSGRAKKKGIGMTDQQDYQ